MRSPRIPYFILFGLLLATAQSVLVLRDANGASLIIPKSMSYEELSRRLEKDPGNIDRLEFSLADLNDLKSLPIDLFCDGKLVEKQIEHILERFLYNQPLELRAVIDCLRHQERNGSDQSVSVRGRGRSLAHLIPRDAEYNEMLAPVEKTDTDSIASSSSSKDQMAFESEEEFDFFGFLEDESEDKDATNIEDEKDLISKKPERLVPPTCNPAPKTLPRANVEQKVSLWKNPKPPLVVPPSPQEAHFVAVYRVGGRSRGQTSEQAYFDMQAAQFEKHGLHWPIEDLELDE